MIVAERVHRTEQALWSMMMHWSSDPPTHPRCRPNPLYSHPHPYLIPLTSPTSTHSAPPLCPPPIYQTHSAYLLSPPPPLHPPSPSFPSPSSPIYLLSHYFSSFLSTPHPSYTCILPPHPPYSPPHPP